MSFIANNWQWASWFLTAAIGLGIFGLSFRNINALLAAGAIVGCLIVGGVIYHKGVAAEHARILAETERLNAAAIAVYQQQQRADDIELRRLQKLVDDTPPSSDRVALSAERAKRVGAIR